MPDLTCPFCGLPPECDDTFRELRRCPDVDCPGHRWSSPRRWNTRAPAPPSEGIRQVVDAACALHKLWGLPAGAEQCAGVSLLSDRVQCRFLAAVGNLKPIERDACGVRE